tara:strand:+ start:323 stop:520 length:198 start_codon:yes stop_codon:yes gene_type:complete
MALLIKQMDNKIVETHLKTSSSYRSVVDHHTSTNSSIGLIYALKKIFKRIDIIYFLFLRKQLKFQ